eukprot:GHVR01042754.1.p1 GENE.GHVR01042754.1~~GHVR01042754.1.p1  ORF type:complete len:333 (-),score=84.70 GHVR01042754.1:211-1164(-)
MKKLLFSLLLGKIICVPVDLKEMHQEGCLPVPHKDGVLLSIKMNLVNNIKYICPRVDVDTSVLMTDSAITAGDDYRIMSSYTCGSASVSVFDGQILDSDGNPRNCAFGFKDSGPLPFGANGVSYGVFELHTALSDYIEDKDFDLWSHKGMHVASYLGHTDVLITMIKATSHDFNINNKDHTSEARDYHGVSLLHVGCSGGHIDLVNYIIDIGANVNDTTDEGRVPLHYGCMSGSTQVVQTLLAHKADVKASNEYGWTPIHTCAQYCLYEAALLLLEDGADVNSLTDEGTSPLHIVVSSGVCVCVCVILVCVCYIQFT